MIHIDLVEGIAQLFFGLVIIGAQASVSFFMALTKSDVKTYVLQLITGSYCQNSVAIGRIRIRIMIRIIIIIRIKIVINQ
jgi:hypothetical protein